MSEQMDFEDGKYTVIYDEGHFKALRYGGPWRNLNGDHLVYSMLVEAIRLKEERDALAAELKGQDARIDDLLATCHRLALELECLLLDTKDAAPVSRWWDSAMAALDGWHKAKDAAATRPVPAEPVNVEFGMRGETMFFKIGNQSFALDYRPDEQGEYEFMQQMLLSAFSRITPGVKTASEPVNARLIEALRSIQRYGLDTLSGRADGGDDDRAWQRAAVNEMTKRARIALSANGFKVEGE